MENKNSEQLLVELEVELQEAAEDNSDIFPILVKLKDYKYQLLLENYKELVNDR